MIGALFPLTVVIATVTVPLVVGTNRDESLFAAALEAMVIESFVVGASGDESIFKALEAIVMVSFVVGASGVGSTSAATVVMGIVIVSLVVGASGDGAASDLFSLASHGASEAIVIVCFVVGASGWAVMIGARPRTAGEVCSSDSGKGSGAWRLATQAEVAQSTPCRIVLYQKAPVATLESSELEIGCMALAGNPFLYALMKECIRSCQALCGKSAWLAYSPG